MGRIDPGDEKSLEATAEQIRGQKPNDYSFIERYRALTSGGLERAGKARGSGQLRPLVKFAFAPYICLFTSNEPWPSA